MKDANPHIFRSLEKVSGPGEFDTIVSAAVASYGALRSPSETQARDFARLVTPLWDKLLPETKRTLGAALSKSSRVPREIVDRILAEPIETAAPFLVSSPVLSETDRLPLRKTIDSKRQPDATLREPKPWPSVAETQGTPVAPEPAVPRRASQRARLLERNPPWTPARHPSNPEPLPHPSVKRFGAWCGPAARRRRPHDERSRTSSRWPSTVRTTQPMRRSPRWPASTRRSAPASQARRSGEFLAVALKALGLGPADALTVLMMLKPRIGLDTAVFDTMRATIAPSNARTARFFSVAAGVSKRPLFSRSSRISKAPIARRRARTFGRRSTRPGLPETKARSA